MKKEHESVLQMWKKYLKSVGENFEVTKKKYISWSFDNNEKDANMLLELVLEGKKRGTASSLWVYEFDGESIPQEGDLSITTDWNGIAKCIIQTTKVSIVPYKDVDRDFAEKEGEGDLTLEHWRSGHENYFKQECQRIKKSFSENMPVICEEFEVVFK